MNIVVLSHLFPPEPLVSAQIACSLSKKLSDMGHKVTVVTAFPNRPAGTIYPGYKNKLYSKEKNYCGFEVVRCFTAPSSKSTFFSRFIENIVFGISAAAYLAFMSKPDIIYSDTWPIIATGLMCMVSKLRGIPYVITVGDLYPESIVSQKRLRDDHWLIKLMRKIDQRIAQCAQHIIVFTNSFARVYQEDRKVSPDKITVVSVWVDEDLNCGNLNEDNAIRRELNLFDKEFFAVYGGNIGIAAGVDVLIKACALIEGVHVIIAGCGTELCKCQELSRQIAPGKVSFYTPWPKEKTTQVYQTADILILPTYCDQSIASIPSKMVRYMLSGRPIIAAGLPGTELWNIMTTAGCGWLVPPDDPEALAKAILMVKEISVEERNRRGEAGRQYALSHHTSETCLPKVVKILETAFALSTEKSTSLTNQA